MDNRLVESVTVGFAVLAVGANIYFRFVRDWAMGFGPMILVGLGIPLVLGLLGVVVGRRSGKHRSMLIMLNLLAIGLGIAVGYII